MKVTLKILLAAAVVLLVYMCYKSVTGPIEYDDQKTIRDNAIIARLIEILRSNTRTCIRLMPEVSTIWRNS